MRKHIKPAHPDATIPDPARGVDLPADGLVCDWSVHWARMEMRGDVIVTEIEDVAPTEKPAEKPAEVVAPAAETAAGLAPQTDPAADGQSEQPKAESQAQLPAPVPAAPEEPKADPAPGTVASVPFMITAANRKRLKALGKSDDEIAAMRPEEAQALLADPSAA